MKKKSPVFLCSQLGFIPSNLGHNLADRQTDGGRERENIPSWNKNITKGTLLVRWILGTQRLILLCWGWKKTGVAMVTVVSMWPLWLFLNEKSPFGLCLSVNVWAFKWMKQFLSTIWLPSRLSKWNVHTIISISSKLKQDADTKQHCRSVQLIAEHWINFQFNAPTTCLYIEKITSPRETRRLFSTDFVQYSLGDGTWPLINSAVLGLCPGNRMPLKWEEVLPVL